MDTLEEVLAAWDHDSIINGFMLDKEVISIGKLHSKYIRAMSKHSLRSKKLKQDHIQLKALKVQYFEGKLNGTDTLKELGWEPFQLKVPKVHIDEIYIPADKQLVELILKKDVSDEIVTVCKHILDELKNRTWQIKTSVDYEKYKGGI